MTDVILPLPWERPTRPEWAQYASNYRQHAARERRQAAHYLGRAIHDDWRLPERFRPVPFAASAADHALRAIRHTRLAIIFATIAAEIEDTHSIEIVHSNEPERGL